jgi:cell division protease FtsH
LKKFIKNIGFYLLLIAISILVAQFFMQQSPQTLENFSYSDMLQAIESGNIDQVKIIGNEEVTGSFNGQAFSVPVPPESIPVIMQELRSANVNIQTEPQPSAPWWMSILGYILPIVILIVAWFFIMQRMQGGGSKMMSFGKSKAKLNENKKEVTFDDVANYEEVKEELQEVVEFLKNPKKFARLGAEVPKGVLLVGPPGTGKTLMARAIAGEAKVPFYFISGSDFVEMFVGVGASRVRDLFEKGKDNAPCIIFVDELDAVGRQRGAGLGGGHDEREQTLNQLLVEMDGFEPNEGVILMAATNRPDILDPALLRPGRFDRRVVVDRPDRRAREAILKIHVKDKPIDDSVDMEVLARRTPGFTGADMENLANEAAILAARRDNDIITMVEFDDAIDRVIAGPQKKSRVINDKEKNLVAYHETGHALLGELLENADRTHKVSIIPRGSAGGFTIPLPEDDKNFMTKRELFDKITALLGGRASEDIFLEDISTGAQNDLERATKIARAMVTEYGMSDKVGHLTLGQKHDEQVFLGRDISNSRNYSEKVAAEIDREVRSIIEYCYEKAQNLLKENRDSVERIVKALKEKETLNAKQINKLIDNKELKEEGEYGNTGNNKDENKNDEEIEEKTSQKDETKEKEEENNLNDSENESTSQKEVEYIVEKKEKKKEQDDEEESDDIKSGDNE